MHPVMKFQRSRLSDAFEQFKDIFVNREENVTIEISFFMVAALIFVKSTVNLEITRELNNNLNI